MSFPSPPDVSSTALIEEGHRLCEEGQPALAEIFFRKAVAADPLLPMAHNNIGWVRQCEGDYKGAISSFKAALSLNKKLRIAQVNLARLLSKIGRFAEADPIWEEVLGNEPREKERGEGGTDGCPGGSAGGGLGARCGACGETADVQLNGLQTCVRRQKCADCGLVASIPKGVGVRRRGDGLGSGLTGALGWEDGRD